MRYHYELTDAVLEFPGGKRAGAHDGTTIAIPVVDAGCTENAERLPLADYQEAKARRKAALSRAMPDG